MELSVSKFHDNVYASQMIGDDCVFQERIAQRSK